MQENIRDRLKAESDRLYRSYEWDMPPGDDRTLEDRIRHVQRWRGIQNLLRADPPMNDDEIILEYLKLPMI